MISRYTLNYDDGAEAYPDPCGEYVDYADHVAEVMRLKLLMGRYATHVRECEGIDFLGMTPYSSDVNMADTEKAEVSSYVEMFGLEW